MSDTKPIKSIMKEDRDYAKKKSPVKKLIIKGGFEIPESTNENNDSMINDEEVRIVRLVTKNFTLQQKEKQTSSRFQKFFNSKRKNKFVTPTQELINNLSPKRKNKKYISVKNTVLSRLISSKNLNFFDLDRYFELHKEDYKEKFKSCINKATLNLCVLYASSENLTDSPFKKSKNNINSNYLNPLRPPQLVNKTSNITLIKANSDSNNNIFRFNEKLRNATNQQNDISFSEKNEISNRSSSEKSEDSFFKNNDVNTLPIFNVFSPIDDPHDNIKKMPNNKLSFLTEFNRNKSQNIIPDYSNKMNTSIQIEEYLASNEVFLDFLLDTNKNNLLFNKFYDFPSKIKQKVMRLLGENLEKIILNPKLTSNIISLIASSHVDLKDIHVLFENADLNTILKGNDFKSLLNFISSLVNIKKDKENILQKVFFDKINWKEICFHKNAKSICEFMIDTFSEQMETNFLFQYIESNVIEFSINNNSTYVVQHYITKTKSESVLLQIMTNLLYFTESRNGVFVVLTALNTYKNKKLFALIDLIIEKSEILCKETYGSTLIEKVFNNFITYAPQKFVFSKKQHLLELIEDPKGNFIIQKLLQIVDKSLKEELVYELNRILYQIKKKILEGNGLTLLTFMLIKMIISVIAI